jgi:hypothetical protein
MAEPEPFDIHILNKYVELVTKTTDTMATVAEIQRQQEARKSNEESRERERDIMMERIARALEQTEKRIERSEADAKVGRADDVDEIKEHMTHSLRANSKWSTIWLGVLSAAAVLAAGALSVIAVGMANR